MRLIVCGGRYFRDVPLLWKTLDDLDRYFAETGDSIRTVIDGASDDVTGPYVGADFWGHQWAIAHDRATIRVHAEWKELGRKAGPIRNQRMIDEDKPDGVVAFPGGTGTADMIAKAVKAGLRLFKPMERGK